MDRLKWILLSFAFSIWGSSVAVGAEPLPHAELSNPSQRIMLRESAQIDGQIIYLGDLFSHTGDKASIALAYAPKPGKRAVFDARWLNRVARAYKLDWRPLSHRDHIVVQRASSVITRSEITEQLREVLIEYGADPDMEIQLSNRQLRLHVAGQGISEIGFENVSYDTHTHRFSAAVFAPIGDATAPRTRLTGRLYPTTEIPVAARRLLKGDIINKGDIRWTRVRTSRLQNDAVSNIDDLIGKSPRRGIREGQTFRASAVQDPVLVEKGSLVTIVLQAPQMFLTAQGKAMQSGSDGDVIRISNTQSNKQIEAEVIGAGRVAVRQSTLLALTN